MRRLNLAAQLGAVVVGLVAVGCGGGGETGEATASEVAVAAPTVQMRSVLANRGDSRLVATMRGPGQIGYLQPRTRRDGNEMITEFRLKNISQGALAGFKVDEFWYDAGGETVTGGSFRMRRPFLPNEVLDVELNRPARRADGSQQLRVQPSERRDRGHAVRGNGRANGGNRGNRGNRRGGRRGTPGPLAGGGSGVSPHGRRRTQVFAGVASASVPCGSSPDDHERAQLRDPCAHSRLVDDPHDVGDILVGLRPLFDHRGRTGGPHMDPPGAELADQPARIALALGPVCGSYGDRRRGRWSRTSPASHGRCRPAHTSTGPCRQARAPADRRGDRAPGCPGARGG